MLVLRLLLLVTLAAVVLAVDRTVEENAVGADVVRASISKIEDADIFPSDKRLLRRIAYVETRDGEAPPNTRNHGGIWRVGDTAFSRTRTVAPSVRRNINAAFAVEFMESNVNSWEALDFEDLNKPLWSALAARVVIYLAVQQGFANLPTASDIRGQAIFWQTYYNSEGDVQKFIDDVEQLTEDESCDVNSDIIFLLDTSGSITSFNFQRVIEFTLKFVEPLDIGPDDNQVGVILFNSRGIPVFDLSTYSDKEALLGAIANIQFIGGFTNIADGLCVLLDGFTEEKGARLSAGAVFRLAVVMTDGQSSSPSIGCNSSSVMQLADKIHEFSPPILVYSIGVTGSVNDEQLRAIASDEDDVVYLNNFDERLFQETRDEQTYELCFRSTIPIELGKLEGTLPKGGSVRYELQVPEEGVTTKLCVETGSVILYASHTVTNPNEALHDFKREVVSHGSTSCDDAYTQPQETTTTAPSTDTPTTSVPTAATTPFQPPTTTTATTDEPEDGRGALYISLRGVEEENKFVLETAAGDLTIDADPEKVWPVIVGIIVSVLVVSSAAIAVSIAVYFIRRKIKQSSNMKVI